MSALVEIPSTVKPSLSTKALELSFTIRVGMRPAGGGGGGGGAAAAAAADAACAAAAAAAAAAATGSLLFVTS